MVFRHIDTLSHVSFVIEYRINWFLNASAVLTLFFLGGGVSCVLLTRSSTGVSGELQAKTPMSRGMSTSLRRTRTDGQKVNANMMSTMNEQER